MPRLIIAPADQLERRGPHYLKSVYSLGEAARPSIGVAETVVTLGFELEVLVRFLHILASSFAGYLPP